MDNSTRNVLLTPSPPWVVKADLRDEEDKGAIDEAGQFGVVVELDGGEARTLDGFFALLSRRFEFPDYFGGNWPAVRDCLADLEWLPADSYCLLVRNSDLLFGEEPVERATFIATVKVVAEEWATAVELGEWWDRPAIPFHTVLDQGISAWDPGQLEEIDPM